MDNKIFGKNSRIIRIIGVQGSGNMWEKSDDASFHLRLGPAQDVHFFYTRSYLSSLQNCAIILSTHFQSIFTFKNALHNLVIILCSALKISQKYSTVVY